MSILGLTPGELASLVALQRCRAERRRVQVVKPASVRDDQGYQIGAKDPGVWLRLVALGMVAGRGNRLQLTRKGLEALGARVVR